MSTETPNAETKPVSPSDETEREEVSFAETAFKLAGKSDDEARRTGAVDSADDQVEKMFAPKYQTANSPAHRAVWDRKVPVDLFDFTTSSPEAGVAKVMDDSLAIVRKHREAGNILNEKKKIRPEILQELGGAGYWGLLVDKEHGGSGAKFANFAQFLTQMAMLDPTISGLASVHGCIGAVDPVRTFGNAEQKERFLPRLASGERLSAFALTEPGAGSDLTALSTVAELQGDEYVVNGEKLFITNVQPGRTIGLVCLIEDKPAVLIVDLPDEENENFQLVPYGIYAMKHTYNMGIKFNNLRVPAENLLKPGRGDGLTIAYHGLNLGRVALCAAASGNMRNMMASMIPWAKYRKTYGATISTRELVQRRLGHLAGYIGAADGLSEWCANLIDQGYRGEMECIIAKIFGSEAQKDAAIELFMKTHGGRSFLEGHILGDNIHEFLAPCIYEGEGEMLGMAYFKSLVKQHGKQFFEPIGFALQKAGIKQPNMMNPSHLMALSGPMMQYGKWLTARKLQRSQTPDWPRMPKNLKVHAEFAADWLQRSSLEITGTMRKFQLKLADRQCRMSELSQRVQDATTMLCTALYAARQTDTLVQDAADCFCQHLTAKLLGRRPSDRYFRSVTAVGEAIVEGGFKSISGLEPDEIMMPYK